MPVYTQTAAQILVFTFKEGLLSKVAHDLQLHASSFRITVDPVARTVQAEVDAGGVEVDHAMKKGQPDPGTLKDKDRRDIGKSLAKDVLAVKRFPVVRFSSDSWTDHTLSGTLSLHGQQRAVRFALRRDGDALVAETSLDQRDFGIKPFKALMGALKVQPVVKLRVRLPVG